jgi:drug/metabolite transporter (DMT)-like permease
LAASLFINNKGKQSMKAWQANMGLLMCALIWGSAFVATDVAFEFLRPIQMQTLRYAFAAVILSVICYKKVLTISRATLRAGLMLSVVFFFAFTSQSYGLAITTPSKNAFFTTANVIMVPLILYFFAKKCMSKDLIYGIALMMVGFFFICFELKIEQFGASLSNLGQQFNFNVGDGLSLLCALGFALHIILTGKYVLEHDGVQLLLVQTWFTLLASFLWQMSVGESFSTVPNDQLMQALWPCLYMAVFSSIVAYGGQLLFQKYTPPSNTAVLLSLESVFACLFSVALGREPYFSGLFVGGLLILFGVIWAEVGLFWLRPTLTRLRPVKS